MSITYPKISVILVVSFFVFVGLIPPVVAASAEYSGAYTSDVTWSESVTVAGDVLIQEGATLTIKAGTQVNVVPAAGTKIDPEYLSSQTELLVRGRLDIQGTVDRPVRFVVTGGDPTDDYAWAGITLDGARESRVRFVEITHAETAIRCVGSSPEIVGNRISNCRYGIIAQQESHPKVLNNTLVDGEGGIFCWRGSNPYLLENNITGHDEEAVFVDADSRPWLDRNMINNNAIGLALYAHDLPYDPNEIIDNGENVRWLGSQGQKGR